MLEERCIYCVEKQKFYCQVPSVSEIVGRWIVSLNGGKPKLDSETTVENCPERKAKEEKLVELRKMGIVPGWARIGDIKEILSFSSRSGFDKALSGKS